MISPGKEATMQGPFAILEGLPAPELAIGHEEEVEHHAAEQHCKAALIGTAQQELTQHVD
jgi:hypothetical protein